MRVLLVTEGSYPVHFGGLGNWCDMLVRDLDDVEFIVLGMVGDPRGELRYRLPDNVVRFVRMPLWGVREALENRRDLGVLELLRRARGASDAVVAARFLPAFRRFVTGLFDDTPAASLGPPLATMYRFFLEADYDATMKSRPVWDCFADTAVSSFLAGAAHLGYPRTHARLDEVSESLSLLYHWLMPLAAPLPRADVVHAASAGLCGVVGVVSKLEYGSPFILTEHGIYLRERYLAEIESDDGLFRKVFRLRFARRLTELGYATADRVAPGSQYNRRWELALGARPSSVRTVYNGVDPQSFSPAPRPASARPTIVWLGRIDPVKDLVTLLEAAALLRASRPDIQVRIFGRAPPASESYYVECVALRDSLGLADTVHFEGYAPSARDAFNQGDVVVLSSISEGFPYSIVEALLCGKPVIATAVGGVPEAVDGCGVIVEPRNPRAMADAMLSLMGDSDRRLCLGLAARKRAASEFTLARCSDGYRTMYRELLGSACAARA